ncbi:MAG: hypothetical protein QOD42_3629 [Sphingomonadales bacterium]|jgi:hypothetical protein|nr:hypothetical protein [Sphingomonadales bacterium]
MDSIKGWPRSRFILIGIAVLWLAIALLSERPWGLTSTPRIREIQTLPDNPQTAALRRWTSILVPYLDRERRPEVTGQPPIKLGWSYREYSIFTMPVWAQSEEELVFYVDAPDGREFTPLNPQRLDPFDRLTGVQAPRDYSFPWYLYMWGWWVLIALIAWTLVKRKEDLAREEALWNS